MEKSSMGVQRCEKMGQRTRSDSLWTSTCVWFYNCSHWWHLRPMPWSKNFFCFIFIFCFWVSIRVFFSIFQTLHWQSVFSVLSEETRLGRCRRDQQDSFRMWSGCERLQRLSEEWRTSEIRRDQKDGWSRWTVWSSFSCCGRRTLLWKWQNWLGAKGIEFSPWQTFTLFSMIAIHLLIVLFCYEFEQMKPTPDRIVSLFGQSFCSFFKSALAWWGLQLSEISNQRTQTINTYMSCQPSVNRFCHSVNETRLIIEMNTNPSADQCITCTCVVILHKSLTVKTPTRHELILFMLVQIST